MTAEKVTTSEGQHTFQMEGEDITQKKDGGVLKLLKREGTGTELPMAGDKIYIHYVGTLLDGTKFDSSRDQNERFSFEIGKGEVIKAWDLGVATMKAGEISQFICKPAYAYGEAGSPPKVPPHATLVFEVELFEFHGEDITEDEDRGIVRRIVTRGGGYAKPSEGCAVQVSLEGMLGGTVFDQRELSFEIGDGERLGLPVGVEKAIMSMEEGEESLFTIVPKYGFGNAGNAKLQVPSDAVLQYRIKLTAFERAKESWEMNTTQKVEESTIAKGKGTQYFKEGKYKLAVGQYKRIVTWLARESGLRREDEQKVQALQLAAHLNLAMCYLRMQQLSLALESCNKALELDDSNEKALFRRGEALFAMQEYEQARDDFQRVLQVYPTNRAARVHVTLCHQHIKEQHEKDKRIYANMFQKFAERDTRKGLYGDSKKNQNGSMDAEEYGTQDHMAA